MSLFNIREKLPPIGQIGSTLITTFPDSDKVIERAMVQCAHCGAHGFYRPGCGNKIEKCQRCDQFVCPKCSTFCVPWELMLDNMDLRGMPYHEAQVFRPVVVSTAGLDLLGGFTGDTGTTEPKSSA